MFLLLVLSVYFPSMHIYARVCYQTGFLDSILGTGLMLYVSETWLSQIYRGIRHQDLLSTSGLDLKLLRGSVSKSEGNDLRGACLVEMLVESDGIGWTYDVSHSSLFCRV